MSLETLLATPAVVTLRRPSSSRDVYNNVVEAETVISTFCYLEQKTRTENTVNEDRQSEEWDVLLPALYDRDGVATELELTGSDRLEAAGLVLELYGPPQIVREPRTGRRRYIEASARRSTGTESDGSGS